MAEGGGRWRRLRKYLVTGLLIWVPVTVTLLVLRLLVNLVDQTLILLPMSIRPETLLGFHIPGLGIVLAAALLVVTGMLFSNLVGRRLVAFSEAQLGRVPFVGSIYRGSKQVTETLLAPGSKSFRKVMLIPWPHGGSRTLAFVAGNSPDELRTRTGEDLVSVFVPTTPNPTSGFLIMVRRQDAVELEMSVEEAFRMIVSLGVVHPSPPPEKRVVTPGAASGIGSHSGLAGS